jgi:hypothetical protein
MPQAAKPQAERPISFVCAGSQVHLAANEAFVGPFRVINCV